MNKKALFRKPLGYLILAAILLFSLFLAARIGSVPLTASQFFGGLFHIRGYEKETLILYQARLPRLCGALIAGAGMSISGVLLQNITGNDLASPNIIGVNSGAGLAVILLLWLIPSASLVTPLAAFIGAFVTTLLIITLASTIQNNKATLILAGIAVTAMLNAAISFISLLDTDILTSYNAFSIGSLSSLSLDVLWLPALLIVFGTSLALLLSRSIDTLCLGDAIALSLGINVKRLRQICMIIASACAASVVSFAGLLGFVGLIVPHIARRLCGSNTKHLIGCSLLIGPTLVLIGDLLGRILFAPSEIPVGIMMALIGAPFFFMLLLRRRNHDSVS